MQTSPWTALDLVFSCAMFTVFRIDKSRGSQVFVDVLGKEFKGLIGCDSQELANAAERASFRRMSAH